MLRSDSRLWLTGGGCLLVVVALAAMAFAGLPLALEKDAEDPYLGSSGGHGHGGGHHGDPLQDGASGGEQPAQWYPGQGISPWGLEVYNPPIISHEHTLAAGEGKIPTRSEAMGFQDRYSSLRARGTGGLDRLAEQGHLTGSGSLEDPYVLERFYVDGDLVVESTERALVIREGYVSGQLKLNYVGGDLLVHHVYASDLRVNENIRRAGPDTGGLFHDNEFGFIGQLRHFSGEFRDNKVGPKPDGVAMTYLSDTGVAQIPKGLVFNFDGFHGASVHSNEIQGRVDIKVHGHYHGDCLTCLPHDHNDPDHFPPEDRPEGEEGNASQADGHDHDHDQAHDHDHGDHGHHDHGSGPPSHHAQASKEKREWLEELGLRSHHSIRYHSLHFHDNRITVEDAEIALRYYDRAHRGDDETAASEPNPHLEDPHVHYSYIWLEGNILTGGRLMVDVFNAEDERHVLADQGVVRIEGNHITVPIPAEMGGHHAPAHGMRLSQVTGAGLLVLGNTVVFEEKDDGVPLSTFRHAVMNGPERIGIIATMFDRGNVTFAQNTVQDGDVGLLANAFSSRVWWFVEGNEFPADEQVRSSNTGNAPNDPPPSQDDEVEDTDDDDDGGDDDDPHAGHDGHGDDEGGDA